MHEDFKRQHDVKTSSDRSFGLIIGAFLCILAFSPLLHSPSGDVRWWALVLGLLFVALAWLWTAPLRPLNKLWTRFGLLLYTVINPIVMVALFYGVFTPVGWLMRASGNDPLRLRADPRAASYWIERTPPGPPPASMKNQF